MNWFLRMKLAHKLLTTFLTCSVLTAAVGVYGLTRISELGGMLSSTYDNNVVSLERVSSAALKLSSHARAYVRLASTKNPDESKAALARAKGYMDNYNKDMQEYRATTLSAKEQVLIKQIDAVLPVYLAENEKVAELALSGKFNEAVEHSNTAARKATKEMERPCKASSKKTATRPKPPTSKPWPMWLRPR